MNRISFAILYILFGIQLSAQTLPDLTIEERQVDSLPPGSYSFDKVHIMSEALLHIQGGSASWTILHANTFILDGSVICRGMKSNAGPITATTKNGKQLSYTFSESAKGGIGGDGGGNGHAIGGKGSLPDGAVGGGGGSGAQGAEGASHAGLNGLGHVGASGPFLTTTGKAGNGGKTLFANGGLLCIHTQYFSSGDNALIDLSGTDGDRGEDGALGGCDRYDQNAGGGGGGGAAGGDGGVLVVFFNEISPEKYPTVDVTAGHGGKGGKGGMPNECEYPGRDGQNGEPGTQGRVDWRPM